MSELVEKYKQLRKKHDSEFYLADGGNGDQVERSRKRDQYEMPLLLKMTKEDFSEIQNLGGLGERMFINGIKKKVLDV